MSVSIVKRRAAHSSVRGWWCVALSFAIFASACGGGTASSDSLKTSEPVSKLAFPCSAGEVAPSGEYQRLALIVGVSRYLSPGVRSLLGASADAERFHGLLTGARGYGFPESNVCLLLDEQATVSNFRKAFHGLIARAAPEDVVVIYFAGHGSDRPDQNGDEPDLRDETLLLHDSRTKGVEDLRDDDFNALLAELHKRTRHITVILDSCNSATGTRGDEVRARYQPPPKDEARVGLATAAEGNGDAFVPATMPGLVALYAAGEGMQAIERSGRGVFTDALLTSLSAVGTEPLTYAQAARQIPMLMAGRSAQIPYFDGDLTQFVFENTDRAQPVAWEIRKLSPGAVELTGPALPGIGVNAEFRVYPGTAERGDVNDPGKAKATLVVTSVEGLFNATARIAAVGGNAPALALGDLAVLVRPSDDYARLGLAIRASSRPGGLSQSQSQQIVRAIAVHSEARAVVQVAEAGVDMDFEVSRSSRGELLLRGPSNRVRRSFVADDVGRRDLVENLWQHARQRALLALRGEGGSDFRDEHTLTVELRPAPKQPSCARGEWRQAAPNEQQIVPLCHHWQVHIRLHEDAADKLLIGGAILSSDGAIFGLPRDGRAIELRPGEEVAFNIPAETFQGTLPLDTEDRILMFGTKPTNPVPWHLLATTARTRSAYGGSTGTLYRALDRYLRPGTRGVASVSAETEDTTWTRSSLSFVVEANPRFDDAVTSPPGPRSRAYTLPRFDIRPYLPDDVDSPLTRLLTAADELTQESAAVIGGLPFAQHDWAGVSDHENLELGIDSSRAIWFAFTRAGLKYNDADRPLKTARMIGKHSLMYERFVDCSASPRLLAGDVLVYRGVTRDVGHAVLVIDPARRTSWGAHGWDGDARGELERTGGVQYQLIKNREDWRRWKRAEMRQVACWRHRELVRVAGTPAGESGTQALSAACDEDAGCGSAASSKPSRPD